MRNPFVFPALLSLFLTISFFSNGINVWTVSLANTVVFLFVAHIKGIRNVRAAEVKENEK